MGQSPSNRRREGRNAFYPGGDPGSECPYRDPYKRDDWIEGWYQSSEDHKSTANEEDKQENEMGELMDLFRRAVVALETIAAECKAFGDKIREEDDEEIPYQSTEGGRAHLERYKSGLIENPPPPDPLEEAAKVYSDDIREDAALTREEIKLALDGYGVSYKPTARTETLAKQLADYANLFRIIPPPAEPEATVDQVRQALCDLSGAKGKDAALGVLKDVGGFDQLKLVDPSRYQKIVDACRAKGDE